MFRGRLPTWDLADGSVGVGHERFQAVEDPDSARTGRSDARQNSTALDDRRLPTGGCWLVPANAQVPRGGSEGWNLYRFERPPSRRFTPLLIVSAPRSDPEPLVPHRDITSHETEHQQWERGVEFPSTSPHVPTREEVGSSTGVPPPADPPTNAFESSGPPPGATR
jgi:hypothetical protein